MLLHSTNVCNQPSSAFQLNFDRMLRMALVFNTKFWNEKKTFSDAPGLYCITRHAEDVLIKPNSHDLAFIINDEWFRQYRVKETE